MPLKLLLMELKTVPILGPRIIRTAMTTRATRVRINAYSTRPWPRFRLAIVDIRNFEGTFPVGVAKYDGSVRFSFTSLGLWAIRRNATSIALFALRINAFKN